MIAVDMLEQWYSMSDNPHHFALTTPSSDHEGETSYTNAYNGFLNGSMRSLMNSAFSGVGPFGLNMPSK
jgi:hypothetical protein